MNEETLKEEKKHLENTVTILEEAEANLKESLKSLGAETVDKLSGLRENTETNAMDFFMFMEQIHEKHQAFNLKDRYARLEELASSIKEPYFARIDLGKTDIPEEKKIYIGKFGYTHENTPLITDWRTKIASIYYRYRYPQKGVSYQTPEGEKNRDLLLKRTFDISDSQLNKYYNNDIQLDESEIITDKIESRTGGVLEDIVETIQEGQLDIIEEDPRTPVVVQGCVGSGKSTVAIHKLSHIFFNFPKYITPQRSILVAKNQILISYLATLFPKLGIFDINYKTLSDLVYNLIFREEIRISPDFIQPVDASLLSMDYLEKLKKIVSNLTRETQEKIEAVFSKNDNAVFGGYKYDEDIPPYENVRIILEDLKEELDTSKSRLKENPKSTRAWLYRMNADILVKIIKDLTKINSDLRTKEFDLAIKKAGLSKKGNAGYAESLAFVYLHTRLIGFTKGKTHRYQYCVIDEGQDFSPLEYAVLDSFVLHKRFCIMGDLNQGYTGKGITSWKDLEKVFETDDIKHFSLDTNYRSTAPIISFANKILSPHTDKYLPKSINRKGKEPNTKEFPTEDSMFLTIAKVLAEDSKKFKKSIGLITFDENSFLRIKEILEGLDLPDERKMILDSDVRINYKPKAIYLSRFEHCKGLEFGKVYVIGRNPLADTSYEEAKKSFVAVTRAMDQLDIYYVN